MKEVVLTESKSSAKCGYAVREVVSHRLLVERGVPLTVGRVSSQGAANDKIAGTEFSPKARSRQERHRI